jgi:hypothetical protein
VGYHNEFYSRKEANYLFDLYFMKNKFLKNVQKTSFTKFKLFLKIMKDQIINFLLLNDLSPRKAVVMANWRNNFIQLIIDCAIRFLNSKMSILSK